MEGRRPKNRRYILKMITKEDIQELKTLQEKLLNAKPDGTRDPRLFILMEPHKEYGLDTQYGCNCFIRRTDEEDPILDDSMSKEEFQKACKKLFEEAGCKDNEWIPDTCKEAYLCLSAECAEWDYELIGYEESFQPNMSRVFFTREAANNYLKKYSYNHPDGTHSYSTYPDERCKEWHLVAKLLREADFDKLLKEE